MKLKAIQSLDTSAYVLESNKCHIMLLTLLPFRLFVVDRWQHTLVLDLAGKSSDQGTDVLFREDHGGYIQKWLVLSDVDPDIIQLLVIEVEPLKIANFLSLCRDHKAAIDKHIGQELRIRNVKTNTVLDWSGGNKTEGKLHSWEAYGAKHHQMVRMRIHA
jgi:hypothetical protein